MLTPPCPPRPPSFPAARAVNESSFPTTFNGSVRSCALVDSDFVRIRGDARAWLQTENDALPHGHSRGEIPPPFFFSFSCLLPPGRRPHQLRGDGGRGNTCRQIITTRGGGEKCLLVVKNDFTTNRRPCSASVFVLTVDMSIFSSAKHASEAS